MLFLREVFSIVLIFAPVETETAQPLDSDVHLNSTGDLSDRTEHGPCSADGVQANGYTLTFYAPSECTRRTPRPDTWVRSATWNFHQMGEADQSSLLMPLVKDALRLVSDCIGSEPRASSEARTTVMIGIRG